jgi:hypothetical protein
MNVTPLLTLPCIGAQLELHPGYVLFRRVGWLARRLRYPDQILAINDIGNIRFFRGNIWLNGVLCIIPHPSHGKSIYAVYSRREGRRAETFYETLDDLVTRKDVLSFIRQHST